MPANIQHIIVLIIVVIAIITLERDRARYTAGLLRKVSMHWLRQVSFQRRFLLTHVYTKTRVLCSDLWERGFFLLPLFASIIVYNRPGLSWLVSHPNGSDLSRTYLGKIKPCCHL